MPDEVNQIRPGSMTSNKPDKMLYPENREEGEAALADTTLVDRMARRPTEADFADVLSPEGNSGDIFGSDVSGSTLASNDSIGGTG